MDRHPPSASQTGISEEPPATQLEAPRWNWWLGGTFLVVALLAVATLLSPWVRNEWGLSLGRRTTPYTQLGFNSATALPATAVRGEKVPVSFVITNDEGKQMSYRYVVASGSGEKLVSLNSASALVAAGGSWTVSITVVPNCTESSCHIKVSLPGQNESIDYLLTYAAKSSKKSK